MVATVTMATSLSTPGSAYAFLDKLTDWLHLVEQTMTQPPNDTTLVDRWIEEAAELAEGFGFEEDTERVYLERILEGYTTAFLAAPAASKPSSLSPLSVPPATTAIVATAPASSLSSLSVSPERLAALCARDQTEQRTPAWYAQMGNILSASELGSLFGSVRARAQLVLAKVNFVPRPQQALAVFSSSMSAFDWGIRFEPVVKQVYEHLYGATIQELGRLIGTIDPRVSASPDGLITAATDPARVGRLIEIKCPVTRQPDGKVPKDYYAQMQMQLHVTGLHECDFVEVVFNAPYSSSIERCGPGLYNGYVALVQTNTPQEDGTVAATFRYEYSPINAPSTWKPEDLKEGEFACEVAPWSVFEWHEQVVHADPTWWPHVKPKVDAFWEDVAKARADPTYLQEHTVPKRGAKAEATAAATAAGGAGAGAASPVCVIKLGT